MPDSESQKPVKFREAADLDLPPALRGVRPAAHDVIERTIKEGGALTSGQIDYLLKCAEWCVQNKGVVLPRSYAACVYLVLSERRELDKDNQRIRAILGKSQKVIEAAGQIIAAREARKKSLEQSKADSKEGEIKEEPKEEERAFIPTAHDHLDAMQAALGAKDYESAVSHAMLAVRYFSKDERILLLAGMCCLGRALKHSGPSYYPESRRSDLEHAIDFFRSCKEHSVGSEGAEADKAMRLAFEKLKEIEHLIFKEDKKREKKSGKLSEIILNSQLVVS